MSLLSKISQLFNPADVNTKDILGRTAIDRAVASGQVSRVMEAFSRGAKIDEQRGIKLIKQTIKKNKSDVLTVLLDNGAVVSDGVLLDNGADVVNGSLAEAIFNKSEECVKVLLEHGADPNHSVYSFLDNRPIMLAVHNGLTSITSLLIQHGADVNSTNACGLTPLMRSIWFNRGENDHFATVRLLLEKGANPNMALTGNWDESLTYKFFFSQRIGITHQLAAVSKGATPLMMACAWGDLKTVSALIEFGADVSHRTDPIGLNTQGFSALNIARYLHLMFGADGVAILKLLKDAGAKE